MYGIKVTGKFFFNIMLNQKRCSLFCIMVLYFLTKNVLFGVLKFICCCFYDWMSLIGYGMREIIKINAGLNTNLSILYLICIEHL